LNRTAKGRAVPGAVCALSVILTANRVSTRNVLGAWPWENGLWAHGIRSRWNPGDAAVRRQLNRMLEGRRMKGSTNRRMMLQYAVAKVLEGQELGEHIIG
jgi:hypothetical protein